MTTFTSTPLPTMLRETAVERPDDTFLIEATGAGATYGEFDVLVRAWMQSLHAAGVRPGHRVVTMLPTGITCLAAWMAVARLGAVEVPINTAYHGELLAGVLADTRADVAVVADRWRERFESISMTVLGERPETGRTAELDDVELAEHDTATVVFTSGTTGRSKGVLIPWRQLQQSAHWLLPLDEATTDDHWYVALPLFHVSGKLSVYAAALTGARAVLREVFSTSSFWSDVRRFGTTTALLPGSAARYLEGMPEQPDDADNPLRNVFVAPFPRDRDAFARRFGVRLGTAFNMTELSCPIVSGWTRVPEGSCGRTRPGVECRVVDEHDRELDAGQVGELVVRTDRPWETMTGYLGAPDATVASWRNLWFHTGDLCRRDEDGWFYFVDRSGDAIRRRGENISASELETALIGHPDVAEAAVVGVPSEWGEHDVKAFVVARNGARLSPEDVSRFAEDALPKFMIPRYVVVVPDLPRTQTQRVQKARLRDWDGPEPVYDRGR